MLPVGAPGGTMVKNPPASAGDIRDLGSVPRPGRSPGEGKGNPPGRSPGEGKGNPRQHSRLENPMDRGAWRATVHGVARVRHD